MIKQSSSKTCDVILKNALKLFSANGLGETSLRAIGREAKVNDASIHYHFGDRFRLIKAAYSMVMAPINQERARVFNEMQNVLAGEKFSCRNLIYCMYWPVFRRFSGRRGRARLSRQGLSLIVQIRVNPSPRIRNLIDQQSDAFRECFNNELERAVPEVDKTVLWRRLSMVNSIAWDSLALPFVADFEKKALEEFFRQFLDFSVSGVVAP